MTITTLPDVLRIVFLDIDGVLNNMDYATQSAIGGFGDFFKDNIVPTHDDIKWDPRNVKQLKRILDDTGAMVVVSSTWRLSFRMDTFRRIFTLYGLDPDRLLDKTKVVANGFRGDEVTQWLDNHAPKLVHSHVILDDTADFHKHQPLVLTDMAHGLTGDDADEAISILMR